MNPELAALGPPRAEGYQRLLVEGAWPGLTGIRFVAVAGAISAVAKAD